MEHIFSLFQSALTLLTAPAKRASLAHQAKEILHNRQPEPLPSPSTSVPQLSPLDTSTTNTSTASMNKNVQELPTGRKAHSGANKDTGFPEPLSPDRNTTLPHPDADTSENATIEAPDIALSHTHSRRSFLSRHHSGYTKPSHGHKDSGISVGLNSPVYETTDEKEKLSPVETAEKRENGVHIPVRASSLGKEEVSPKSSIPKQTYEGEARTSEGSRTSSEDEVLRLKEERDAQGYREGERRKGVLRKLHLHKV